MSSGVYQLDFDQGGKYIGKSVNIERRWEEHIANMHDNKSSQKLQAAYRKYGVPARSVLMYCHPDHIGLVETLMICQFKPTLNSAPTAIISQEDIGILFCTGTMLEQSTGTLVKHIGVLGEHVTRLEREIDFLLEEDDVAFELYQARKQIKDLNLTNKYLKDTETSKPWWKKLF